MDDKGLRYISMFSGIEAATIAWRPLGFNAVAFSEIEKFPSAVLSHRFPDIPNLGDITKTDWSKYTNKADIVVGGPPCQAFSIAGLRLGLSDERGNLSLEYVNAIRTINPTFCVAENVPGWLTSKDNAFGCFLGSLAGADIPAEPGGKPPIEKNNSFWRWDRRAGCHIPKWPTCGWVAGKERVLAWRTLDAQYFGVAQRRKRVFVVGCTTASGYDPRKILFEQSISNGDFRKIKKERDKTAPSTDRGITQCYWNGSQVSNTLDAVLSKQQSTPEKNRFHAVICFTKNDNGRDVSDNISPTLRSGGDGGVIEQAILFKGRLRRITPIEAERLQGFPDNHTLVPYRGKGIEFCPDGPRYKAIGNSMAVPVMAWIGERIKKHISGELRG